MADYKVIYKACSFTSEYIVENRKTDESIFFYNFLRENDGKQFDKYKLTMEQQLILYKKHKKIVDKKKGRENHKIIKEAMDNLLRLEKLKLLDKKK